MDKAATTPVHSQNFKARARSAAHSRLFAKAVVPQVVDDDIETTIDYPETASQRQAYLSPKTNRRVTEFQYRVYDVCRQVPLGYYTTYKAISDHLRSGPRAVGNALSKNPFCPLPIPCHRVLTSDCYIGGFSGDTKSKIFFKKAKLEKEGLEFDDSGFLSETMQQSRFFNEFQ
ncbi:hypothetical protein LPJ78_001906 [Coemansia sp. RSA 989]|nr:6-O-methylguanine DNA methyltransferase [Coemansia mojavensis]KAJ1741134.1 hypothetical protein LPJ68_003118 [Coemansia sp. RSA 1086]KAJ1751640.1 hypothetical protein LPJ79_001909 [Coemansia sp. RSA 1821]KAJ1866335.1 hypothetical protein LPJ78_001906 [Coemansia sp. RSA 989]KAJ1873735.1 hypothetical protein LPJ55_002074 [Coemansia sp. RSA 990]KAJ2632624.1 hypothetical protein H4R22_001128 [Coemansia sp. RSA 1290]KAJ2653899.1 hypothetical protein IWW40_000183 [Coemansia sp. RSA 1250]KAJ2677